MRIVPFLLGIAIVVPAFATVVPEGDFGPITLTGVTSSMQPSLAGGVIYDRLVPFAPAGGARGGTRGQLQVRVLKTAGGRLDFYWSVRNDATSTEAIKQISIVGYPSQSYDVNWRLDGLGSVAPTQVTGATGGTGGARSITFVFGTPVAPGQTSRAFYISTGYRTMVSDPATFARIKTVGGVFYNLPAFLPRP